MHQNPDASVVLTKCVDDAQIDSVVDVLTASFVNDPAVVQFVGNAEYPDAARYNIIFAIANAHFRANEPIFILLRNRQVIGAALVEVRRSAIGEILSIVRTWALWRRLPKGCIKRLNTYRSLARRGSARKTHYLTMVGIRPDLQGCGLGRKFIELLEKEVDPKRGWSLDTENPENVILYEKLGYALDNKVDWELNTIYQMHKSGI